MRWDCVFFASHGTSQPFYVARSHVMRCVLATHAPFLLPRTKHRGTSPTMLRQLCRPHQTDLGYIVLPPANFASAHKQTVIFSEGTLYLDGCDFSGSSTSVLVSSDENATTIIRNAVLGDLNCENTPHSPCAVQHAPGPVHLLRTEFVF